MVEERGSAGAKPRAGRRTTVEYGPDSGASLWGESYDRELTDISTVRTNIAMAIAEALNTPLGLTPQTHLVSNPDIDPKSYEPIPARQSAYAQAVHGGEGSHRRF